MDKMQNADNRQNMDKKAEYRKRQSLDIKRKKAVTGYNRETRKKAVTGYIRKSQDKRQSEKKGRHRKIDSMGSTHKRQNMDKMLFMDFV